MAKKNWLLFPALLLIANLIFRFINQSKMLFSFPLEGTDWPTHIFELWALAKYGFHGLVSNWYNGYILFQSYTPGWYFFALPFMWLTKNVLYATYLSVVAIFVLIAIGLYYFCKTEKISKRNFVIFFALLMANALSISNFIRNGRVTELFAWSIFIFLMIFIFYYKNKPIDIKFILLAPLFALLIISHFVVPLLFSIVLLGFFLVKPLIEKIYVILTVLSSLLLSSFWWFPFITNLKDSYITELKYSSRILSLSDPINFVLVTLIPIIFMIGFYLYWQSKDKSTKELLFFSPILIFGVLFTFKLTAFIPILDRIYPHPAIMFFLFFILYFMFKIDWRKYKILNKLATIFVFILILVSFAVNVVHTPLVHEYGEIETDVLSVLPNIDEKYIILGETPEHFFNFAIYSYGAIYHDLKSSWGGWQTTAYSNEYYNQIVQVWSAFTSKDCENLAENLLELDTTEILSFQDNCQILDSCECEKIIQKGEVCLYKIK